MGSLSLFTGPTYGGRSGAVNTDRCINFIPEFNPEGSKSPLSLIGTPGIMNVACTFGGPISNMIAENYIGPILAVAPSTPGGYQYLYRIVIGGISPWNTYTVTTVGATTFAKVPVHMISNGTANVYGGQTIITDGVTTIINNNSSTVVTTISGTVGVLAPAFSGSAINCVCSLDGYFIAIYGAYGIQVSNLYDGVIWSGLAQQNTQTHMADTIMGVIAYRGQLWIIGVMTTQVWYNAGVPTSQGCPFMRIPGALFDLGTLYNQSIALGGDKLFFLANKGNNSNGFTKPAGVVMFDGYSFRFISPPQITYMITQALSLPELLSPTSTSVMWSFCYSDNGHDYYVLSINGICTWVYDVTTDMWHERSSDPTFNESIKGVSFPGNWLPRGYTYCMSQQYIGGMSNSLGNGTLAYISEDINLFNNTPIKSIRITPHLFDPDDLSQVNISRLQIDLDSTSSLRSPSTEISFSWSEDGGKTYSSTYTPSSYALPSSLWDAGTPNATVNLIGKCFGVKFTVPGGDAPWLISDLTITANANYSFNTNFGLWTDSSGSPGSIISGSEVIFNWTALGVSTAYTIPLRNIIQLTPGSTYWIMGQDSNAAPLSLTVGYLNAATVPSAVATCTSDVCAAFTVTATNLAYKLGVTGIKSEYKSIVPERIIFSQLGSSLDRVAKLEISSTRKRILIGGVADVSK